MYRPISREKKLTKSGDLPELIRFATSNGAGEGRRGMGSLRCSWLADCEIWPTNASLSDVFLRVVTRVEEDIFPVNGNGVTMPDCKMR